MAAETGWSGPADCFHDRELHASARPRTKRESVGWRRSRTWEPCYSHSSGVARTRSIWARAWARAWACGETTARSLRRAGRAARPQGGPVSRDAADARDIGAAPTGFSVFCYRPTSGVGYSVRPNWVLISLVSAAHATDRI